MILADFHTHTSFSSDSKTDIEAMIERAIALGLRTYCITDHMDAFYPHPEFGSFTFDPAEYTKKLSECKEKYKDKIEILTGIELGLRNEPENKEKVKQLYASLLSQYSFDYVIGSTHVLNNTDPYYPRFWDSLTPEQGMRLYFESIIENAAFYPQFLIYGHLDYIMRYQPQEHKSYSYSDYTDLIDQMLRTLIAHGKGIECNTSGYKYGLNQTHPRSEILKRYYELGGELITVGSDAHAPEHVALAFDKAEDLLTGIGFKYYTVFRNQKPEFIKF